ncbi:uncharacterized protein LOC111031429 [Myzus persicae]|uniref:uncharacterized protein LOC111031429 n=1 Tax=Myzus persicae TaxID=13164 RepID=UPI000B93215E|nr:uncharacterized protein LOC111031429 [Myzus persicae]
MNTLSLAHIFEYAQCSPTTRNYVEGEQNSSLIVKGLVIQSSYIHQMPHEVTGELHRQNDQLKIINFTCSCKAGDSEACKHVVAVLLNLNRTSLNDIDTLSKTDVQCEWAKLKEPSLACYKAVSLEHFCCVKKPKLTLNTINDEEIRFIFFIF